MLLKSLFNKASEALENKLPFVLYNLPNSQEIKGLFLKDDTLRYALNFEEQGFVFSPFDDIEKTILFSSTTAETVSTKTTSDELVLLKELEIQTLINPSETTISNHINLVSKGIQEIQKTDLQKVVLSRSIEMDTEKSALEIFKTLLLKYSDAFAYIWHHPKVGTWLGATPETLLAVNGNRFKTMALAGTQAYNGMLDVEWQQKEREEQQIVTNSIKEALESESRQLTISQAETSKAGQLLHLKSMISGNFKFSFNLKNVLIKLHPTPAICGFPKALAKEFISKNEKYSREYYTGFLGELNLSTEELRSAKTQNLEHSAYRRQRGTTNLFVNLRCLKLLKNEAVIYVGGGITKDSNPEAEFWETHKKSQTMLSVI